MENIEVIQPSPLLAPYVKQYWFLTADGAKNKQRSLPTIEMGLVFNRGASVLVPAENRTLPSAYISGPTKLYTDTCFDSLDMIVILFRPMTVGMFGIPNNEFAGLTIALDLLADTRLVELEERLQNTVNNDVCVSHIEQYLLKRIYTSENYHTRRMTTVLTAIDKGNMNICRLANLACLSSKQFGRVFAEHVGLRPKEYLQIIRFRKAMHGIQVGARDSLSRLADDCGYYDKSHLIKEFRILSGYTPTQLFANSDTYSHKRSLFQMAFVDMET